MKTNDIIRTYPIEKKLLEYPERYTQKDFDEYNKLIKNEDFLEKYNKWNNSVSYKSGRKIKPGLKTHRDLGKIFYIDEDENILFIELNNIDQSEYINETQKIKNEINNKNNELKKYNKNIKRIIEKIKNLKTLDDYIIFENKKYGTNQQNIHRKGYCQGNEYLIKIYRDIKLCGRPYCFGPCGHEHDYVYELYRCDNCNIEVSKIIRCLNYKFSANHINYLINCHNIHKDKLNENLKNIFELFKIELNGINIDENFIENYLVAFKSEWLKKVNVNYKIAESLNYAIFKSGSCLMRSQCINCESSVKDNVCCNSLCKINQYSG